MIDLSARVHGAQHSGGVQRGLVEDGSLNLCRKRIHAVAGCQMRQRSRARSTRSSCTTVAAAADGLVGAARYPESAEASVELGSHSNV